MNKLLKRFLLIELLQGMWVTLRHMFRPKITVQYPDEKTPISDSFKGKHAHDMYADGTERCVACKLCEASCPAKAIKIQIGDKDGVRYAKKYEIDQFLCIYCGECVVACPEKAIVQTTEHEYDIFSDERRYMTKEEMLVNGKKVGSKDD